MQEVFLSVTDNRPLTKDVYEMTLQGDLSAIRAPGQFVNLRVEGCYLRRPLSVCDREGDRLTLIYRVVGKGTEILSGMKPGTKINTLTGLGNGFSPERGGERPLLVGGGVGVPPLYYLCRELLKAGARPTVLLGFNTAREVFYEEKFRALGAAVTVLTADGTYGGRGFVTDALPGLSYTYFYACGPMPMFRALNAAAKTPGEYSFEERMGCGFGACMGCSCQTKSGPKRICVEGPVLRSEEAIW